MKRMLQIAVIIALSLICASSPNTVIVAQPEQPTQIQQVKTPPPGPKPQPSGTPVLEVQEMKTTQGFAGKVVQLPLGKPLATAAVDGETLYIGGGFGSYDFYAIDTRSGKLKWYYRSKDDGPTAAIVHRGRVIFNTESCTLEVLDKLTGKPIWSKWLGDPLLSQPAAAGDRVYMVYPDQKSGSHMIISLRLEDGAEVWKQPVSGDVISAPIISEGTVYLTTLDGSSYAFQADTGKLLWKKEQKATSAPWIWKKKLFVSTRKDAGKSTSEGISVNQSQTGSDLMKGKLYAENRDVKYFDPKKQDVAAQKSLDSSVGFGSAPGTAKLGKAEAVQGIGTVSGAWGYQGSRPVVSRGNSYVSMDTVIEKTNPETGKSLWKRELKPKSSYGGRYMTPPIVAGKKIFVGTLDGEIVSMDERDGKVEWRIPVGAPIQSQLSLVGGRLVATTTNGKIIIIDLKDQSLGGWSMWGGNAQHNK